MNTLPSRDGIQPNWNANLNLMFRININIAMK